MKTKLILWSMLAAGLCAFPLEPAAPAVLVANVTAAEPPAVPSPVSTSAPTAKVDGPETWLIGSVPEFRDASTSAKFRRWKVSPKPDSMKLYEEGRVLVIGSSIPKDFTVLLIVSNENGIDLEEFDTKALAAVNTTPVAPLTAAVPQARMEKVPLEEMIGGPDTAGLCYQWAKDKLKSQAPEAEAAIVAKVLRNVRAISHARGPVETPSGKVTIKIPEEMSEFTARECYRNLGAESFGEWKQMDPELLAERPKFFDVFAAHIDALTAADQLKTMGAYEEVWLQAAKGLEQFAGH